jgi:hypothetical protein
MGFLVKRWFCRNIKKLERSGEFHPRHFGSPRCDKTRDGNNSTITLRSGGQGGQALSPPLMHFSFLFCIIREGILQTQKIKKFFFQALLFCTSLNVIIV